MIRRCSLALASLALVAGCRTITITPADLRQEAVAHPERELALEHWSSAVELANRFLASDFRRTLPPGRYELGEAGMRFVGERGELPIRVERTTWGDWIVRTGFAAQEREFGFVVGQRLPVRDALVDHSFFRGPGGELASPDSIASLILHETTHVVLREGTVGFWNGVAYYLEAIFLFRYETHSGERHANGTSEEYRFFRLASDGGAERAAEVRRAFAQHLAVGATPRCAHGAD
jgi:hypothetical protein